MTQINRLVPRCAERRREMVNPVTEYPTQHPTKQTEKQPRNNEDSTRPKRSKKEPDTRVLQAYHCSHCPLSVYFTHHEELTRSDCSCATSTQYTVRSRSAASKESSGEKPKRIVTMIPLSVLRLTISHSVPGPKRHDESPTVTAMSTLSIRLTPIAVGRQSLLGDAVNLRVSQACGTLEKTKMETTTTVTTRQTMFPRTSFPVRCPRTRSTRQTLPLPQADGIRYWGTRKLGFHDSPRQLRPSIAAA